MAMINNANAVLFDLCTRLKDNGVNVKAIGGYEYSEDCSSIDFDEKISDIDFAEHDKRFKDEITQLKHDLEKTYNQLMEVEKDAQEHIAELESELEVKNNLLKIKNGLCKPPMMTVIVAKTINGQDYVKLEDFISVVNDLQNCHSDNAE